MFALQTRKALTIEQINEACYVDMRANKDVFESMRKNPKVKYDGERFSYKVTFYGGICVLYVHLHVFIFMLLVWFVTLALLLVYSRSMTLGTKISCFSWYVSFQRALLLLT